MTARDDCSSHQTSDNQKLYRHAAAVIGFVIILILMIILLIFLILRPSKPNFTLQDIKLYAFNISTATAALTSNLQITFSSRNPNYRIGIYYDKFSVYASYRNQQITLPSTIPPTYQGHKEVAVWSPLLYGIEVPVAPYLALSLAEDQTAGMVLINIRAAGRVRWKVGSFVSAGYRLNLNCPAYVTFGKKNDGYIVSPDVGYQFVEGCHVEV